MENVKKKSFLLRTIYGSTIVNGMNHHCDTQNQICTNEKLRVYMVGLYGVNSGVQSLA